MKRPGSRQDRRARRHSAPQQPENSEEARGVAMGSVKTFKLKKHLAKQLNMNRPLPQWFRMKTGTNIRYNKFRRHWRRGKIGL
mmetsp:Transcript_83414/g.232198  ORF Transcript_83414/g.232198 Transcript_83414/m.232198 type:complete len:83 (+) Transcript_83414:1-249(+)